MKENPTPDYLTEVKNKLAEMPKGDIIIANQSDYEYASQLVVTIAKYKKFVIDKFSAPKKAAKEAHAEICKWEKEELSKVDLCDKIIRQKMTAYYEAEQKRIAAEEARKREEAEKLLALSQEAEAAGETEMAMEAVAEAAMQEATVTYTPKAAGVSMREVWEAVVTDKSKVPLEYMEVNLSALNAVARATKGTLNIPGVKFVKKTVSSVRAR